MQKFSDSVAKYGRSELDAMGSSLAEKSQRLTKFRQDTEERRKVALQKEALAKVVEAEGCVQKAVEVEKELSKDMEAEPTAQALEQFAAAADTAHTAIEGCRQLLVERMRDPRVKSYKAEVVKLSQRLDNVISQLKQAQKGAKDQEKRVFAKTLMKQAAEVAPKLETEIGKAERDAAPLVEEGGKSFITASLIKKVSETLGEHLRSAGLSREEFYSKHFAKDGGYVTREGFSGFLQFLSETSSKIESATSSDDQNLMFNQLDRDSDGKLSKDEFSEMLRERYVCTQRVTMTDSRAIEGSKSLEKLDVDTVVETLQEPHVDTSLGIARVLARNVASGTEGWVTMQGNQGSSYLRQLTAYALFTKSLEKSLSSAQDELTKARTFVNKNLSQIAADNEGLLADAHAALSSLRPEVSALQKRLEQLQQKVETAHQEHARREERERQLQEEREERQAVELALKVNSKSDSQVVELQKQLEEVSTPLLNIVAEDGMLAGELPPESTASPPEAPASAVKEPLTVNRSVTKVVDELMKQVLAAEESLKTPLAKAAKPGSKGKANLWHAAQKDLVAMLQRAKAAKRRAQEVQEIVESACEALAVHVQGSVSEKVRIVLKEKGKTLDQLYKELTQGSEGVTGSSLLTHLASLPGISFSPQQLELLFRRSYDEQASSTASTMVGRNKFFDLFESYYRCAKEIAVTTELDVTSKGSKTLRKLTVGEVVEVLQGPKTESGLTRVYARALTDNLEGWVAVRGSKGTFFLEAVSKPRLVVAPAAATQAASGTAATLERDFQASATVRSLQPGEVLEVLEGPRNDEPPVIERVKVRTAEGSVGWISLTGRNGECYCKEGSVSYKCTSTVALTDISNVKDCQVLRKLDVGELMAVLEGPMEDGDTGVVRIRVKTMKDDKEGWVTIKGNAGTVYAEESGRQYVVETALALQKALRSTAEPLKELQAGAVVTLLDGPRREQLEAEVRVKCYALSDGAVGWATIRNENLRPWEPSTGEED